MLEIQGKPDVGGLEYPHVTIVVLNWNGWHDTVDCLDSLSKVSYLNFDVIVADNGSDDDSVERIGAHIERLQGCDCRSSRNSNNDKSTDTIRGAGVLANMTGDFRSGRMPVAGKRAKKLSLIVYQKNMGFAEGNNIVMRHILESSQSQYVLLLNNDATVDREFLTELVSAAEREPAVGFAGPKTYYADFKGRRDVVNFAGGNLAMFRGEAYHIGINEIDEGQYDIPREVDFVEGSCLLVKREVLRKIGPLDSRFFAYWEECDWCVRGAKAGYKSYYVPSARIWHKVAATGDRVTKQYLLTRNRLWFMRRNANRYQYAFFIMYFVVAKLWMESGGLIVTDAGIRRAWAFARGIKDGLAKSLMLP